MELKTIAGKELKADLDKMEFEGYASAFDVKDSWGDIVRKGAFLKTIGENFGRIKVLANHNVQQPIGLPIKLEEDSIGLYFKAKVSKTTIGIDTMQLIKDKVITEMSIGYDVIKDNWSDEGYRELKEVRLWEFSPVTWGANSQALIKSLKQNGGLNDIMSLLALLEKPPRKSKNNPDDVQLSAILEQLKQI